MAGREYTAHQKKIIDNYYQHRGELSIQKLQDLVAEIYLAPTDKKRDQLWKRVHQLLEPFELSERLRDHIFLKRSPEVLAEHLKVWWSAPPPLKKAVPRG